MYFYCDSNYYLSERLSIFVGSRSPKTLISYDNVLLFLLFLFNLFVSKSFQRKSHTVIIGGFRLPDQIVLKVAFLFNLRVIYVQHGFFVSHLRRSSAFASSKTSVYSLYFILAFFLGINIFDLFSLYRKGFSRLRGFSPPSIAIVYNQYWEDFHTSLLNWDASNVDFYHCGTFDLSRNTLKNIIEHSLPSSTSLKSL